MEVEERARCPGCSAFLREPYIHCEECPDTDLCLHCFARGVEMAGHQSDHRYEVIKNDFQLFDKGWSAAEEIRLLEAISECGIDNWSDIAHQMRTKSKEQCQHHYTRCYLEKPQSPLPAPESIDLTYFPCPVPFKVSEDPPRPADNSQLQLDMSGYMAARADFSAEFDNFAECNLREVVFYDSEEQIDRELKLAVVDIYNGVLKERNRRKDIVREHGLIHIRKQLMYNRYYERKLGINLQERLVKFCSLISPLEWDSLLEGLMYCHDLRNGISEQQEFRDAGIRTLLAGKVYTELKQRRREAQLTRGNLMEQLENHIKDERACASWLQKHKVLENLAKGLPLPLPNETRRSAPPLQIVGMPGFDRLNDQEKRLCSVSRIVPSSFLEFKQILIREASTHGQLKLAQARTLIKIDVNKTRKIFDYLVENGYINKGS